jgi:hypothetical protein
MTGWFIWATPPLALALGYQQGFKIKMADAPGPTDHRSFKLSIHTR